MNTKSIRNTLASLFPNLYDHRGQSTRIIVVFGMFESSVSELVVTVISGHDPWMVKQEL